MNQLNVRVGVGVIIKKEGKVLFGKRKSSHGEGYWAFPGGHLDFGENIFDCALREIEEEVGIKVKNLKEFDFTNDFFEKENKHYITIFISADYESGEVELKEPNKCDGWEWFDLKNFPEPLFLPIQNLLKKKRICDYASVNLSGAKTQY